MIFIFPAAQLLPIVAFLYGIAQSSSDNESDTSNYAKAIGSVLLQELFFFAETVFESVPQALLQLVAITIANSANTIQLVSLFLSLGAVIARVYPLCQSVWLEATLLKFSMLSYDIISTFFTVSVLFSETGPYTTFFITRYVDFWAYFFLWKLFVLVLAISTLYVMYFIALQCSPDERNKATARDGFFMFIFLVVGIAPAVLVAEASKGFVLGCLLLVMPDTVLWDADKKEMQLEYDHWKAGTLFQYYCGMCSVSPRIPANSTGQKFMSVLTTRGHRSWMTPVEIREMRTKSAGKRKGSKISWEMVLGAIGFVLLLLSWIIDIFFPYVVMAFRSSPPTFQVVLFGAMLFLVIVWLVLAWPVSRRLRFARARIHLDRWNLQDNRELWDSVAQWCHTPPPGPWVLNARNIRVHEYTVYTELWVLPDEVYSYFHEDERRFLERTITWRPGDFLHNNNGQFAVRRYEVGNRVIASCNVEGHVRVVLESQGLVGVEWDKPLGTGQEDGVLAGEKYWDCPEKHGVFYAASSKRVGATVYLTVCRLGTVRVLLDHHLEVEWDERGDVFDEFVSYDIVYTTGDEVCVTNTRVVNTICTIATGYFTAESPDATSFSINVDSSCPTLKFRHAPPPCDDSVPCQQVDLMPVVPRSMPESPIQSPLPLVTLHYPLPHEIHVMRQVLERPLDLTSSLPVGVRMFGHARVLSNTGNSGKFCRCNIVVGETHCEASRRHCSLSFPLHEVNCVLECRTNPYLVAVCLNPHSGLSDFLVSFWGDFGAKKAFIAAIATAFKGQIGFVENAADHIYVCRLTNRIEFVFNSRQ